MALKFHIALSVNSLEESIADYTLRLGAKPEVTVPNNYALWRTDILNFSIRQEPQKAGQLRHLGFEDSETNSFTLDTDTNGVVWERFTNYHQREEIMRVFGMAN